MPGSSSGGGEERKERGKGRLYVYLPDGRGANCEKNGRGETVKSYLLVLRRKGNEEERPRRFYFLSEKRKGKV